MSKDRILWLDTLKVMAIYLVVLGHIVSTTYQPNLKGIIYSFHMPLFFMISGYLNKDKRNAIKANVFALIVPYVLLCVLYFPFYALYFSICCDLTLYFSPFKVKFFPVF